MSYLGYNLKMELIDKLAKQLNITLEFNNDIDKGHLVSKDAFLRAKKQGKQAFEVASEIVNSLTVDESVISKIEAVSPGFINIFLTDEFLLGALESVGAKQDRTCGVREKIIVEYTDPNPFKVFHIGHLLPNIIGQAFSNIYEYLGKDVKRVCYQGDVGMHVAKAIYGIKELGGTSFVINNSLSERADFLGKAYVLGSNAFDESDKVKEQVKVLNKKIYEKDPEILQDYELGRKWSLEKFEEIYKRLGTKFDHYYFESDTAKVGLEVVEEGLEKKVFEESEGAIVYKGEKEGLHTRVFVNSEGLATYEAKELGLAKTKYNDFKYDKSIIVTGSEINEYFNVLISALCKLYPELGKKTKHIGHGMLTLTTGKMSSRKGNVIFGEDLLNMAKDKILDVVATRQDLSKAEKAKIAEQVAMSAVKYMVLKPKTGMGIIFDINESVRYDGNSGPYLQYSVVRANSVLNKIQIATGAVWVAPVAISDMEKELILKLMQFNETIFQCTENYSTHYLSNYLFELASLFSGYYARVKIDEGQDTKGYRISLLQKFVGTMTTGLSLLGIQVPEKM